jgi:hypothetical protein
VTRRGLLLLLTLATSVIVGACSGGSEPDEATASTTTPAPVVTTAPTTSAPATTPSTTSAPTTTATAPTTSAPITEPSVDDTAPPAPTSVDMAQVEQDVINAVAASWNAYLEAARDPFDPEKLERMVLTTSGGTLELRTKSVAEIAASGVISRPNPDVPATIDFYDDTIIVNLEAGTASVEYCRVGSDLGVVVGGNPDGTDKVVVNEHNAYHERVDLVLTGGRWITNSDFRFAKFPGAVTCDR